MGRLFAVSARHGVPLTLRSGGTSLSGQAVTDGILVDVRQGFRTIEVLDDGARVRTQPGVTVRRLNAELARYGRKIGPDPASKAPAPSAEWWPTTPAGWPAAPWKTLTAHWNRGAGAAVGHGGRHRCAQRRRAAAPRRAGPVQRPAAAARPGAGQPGVGGKIRQQFAMKNTMGYGLNALLDYDAPCQILAHLIVGSEGTLGFVAEVTLRTVPLLGIQFGAAGVRRPGRGQPRAARTGGHGSGDPGAAGCHVAAGRAAPARRAGQIATLEVTGQAALLLEYQSTDRDELAALTAAAAPMLAGLPLQEPAELTGDPAVRGRLWKLRKGLYASVAGARASGTTALLEDVVVPVQALAETCAGLDELFDRYRYRDSVIFGHAKDGNIHFLITDRFADDEPLSRYADFTEDMVDLVLARTVR